MPTEKDRYYSRPPQTHNVSMGYGYSSTAVATGAAGPTTGNWIPFTIDAMGNVQVAIAGSISVSGVTIDQSIVEGLLRTGNQFLGDISGSERATLTYLAAISGNTSGSNRKLSKDTDNITIWTSGNSTVSNIIPSGGNPTGNLMVTGQVLGSNANRISWFIQNSSTTAPLYVQLGGATATSANSYNFILNPAGTAGYGGGSYFDDGARWRGAVRISGNGPFIAWEI